MKNIPYANEKVLIHYLEKMGPIEYISLCGKYGFGIRSIPDYNSLIKKAKNQNRLRNLYLDLIHTKPLGIFS